MPGEAELVQDALGGSEEAFAELVRLHQGRIRAYLARHVRDRDVADDLAQETFLDAYRTLTTFRQEAPFRIWLIGIARNRALAYFHVKARRRVGEGRTLEAKLTEWRCQEVESDTNRLTERSEELSALAECVKKLPPQSRRLVETYYSKGMSAAEIAAEVREKGGSIRMRLLRLRQALRRCMEQRLSVQEA